MSVERVIYCDGPTCGGREEEGDGGTPYHVQTRYPAPHLPGGFIEVQEGGDIENHVFHFCGWNCLLKYAAKFPPPERIEFPPTEPPPTI